MRATFEVDSGTLVVRLEPEHDDTPMEALPHLSGSTMRTQVPADWTLAGTHPDLLGLVVALCVEPWTTRQIVLDRAVSQAFADVMAEHAGLVVSPVDPMITPRLAPSGGRPGLAFSGGADSMAALEVMPEETGLYFLERVDPGPDVVSKYDKSAAVHACEELAKAGRFVRRVPCDLEYLRTPVGFPSNTASAVPAVLLADLDGLDSIGWGIIAETSYRIGADAFIEYVDDPDFQRWQPVFRSVGLDFLNAVAGVSEVGTSQIMRMSPIGALSQPCIRGKPGKPCGQCWKCVRKSLLDSSLGGEWPNSRWVATSLSAREPMRYLSELPIKHECVLTYALSDYSGDVPELQLLRTRVRADTKDVRWLNKHYPPALELVPSRYRDGVRARLESFIEPMSEAEQEQFRGWSIDEVVVDRRYAALSLAFRYATEVTALRFELDAAVRRMDKLHSVVLDVRRGHRAHAARLKSLEHEPEDTGGPARAVPTGAEPPNNGRGREPVTPARLWRAAKVRLKDKASSRRSQ